MNLFNNILNQLRGCLKSLFLCHAEERSISVCGLNSRLFPTERFANVPQSSTQNDLLYLPKLFKYALRVAILSSLLLITICCGFVPPAQAATTNTQVVTIAENNKRIQAIATCLPAKLTIQQNTSNRIANALSEMKNDQLQRIFDVTDTPKLSDSEIQFKTCLQQKGFTPQAELQNRSFY